MENEKDEFDFEEKKAEQIKQELEMTKQWLKQSQDFIERIKEIQEGQSEKIEELVDNTSRQEDLIDKLTEEKQELINKIRQLEEKLGKTSQRDNASVKTTSETRKPELKVLAKTAEEIGDEGEDKTTAAIKRMKDLGYPIHNLRFYYGHLRFTVEIDNVFVCNRGVFVFETKNWNAEISGDTDAHFWKYKNTKSEYDYYNPIMQNNTHIKQIKNVAKVHADKFHNIIVFAGSTTFKLSRMENFFLKPEEIRDYIESQPVIYNELQTKDIYNKINSSSQPITHEEHLRNIEERKKYKL
jgi:seryl-tRNA synthetase